MNIEKFVKEDMGIRVKYLEEGELSFSLEDLAKGIGLVNKRDDSIRFDRVKDYVLNIYENCSEKIPPELVELEPNTFVYNRYIEEHIMYLLLMKGKSEKAVEFQVWVAKEVLPSLRKNGYYLNEDMSSEQYEKLQEELRIRNQQVDNFSNMIGGNTRKKQKLETFLKDMFPHIKDGYKQFLNNMVSSGSLDSNFNPTEAFKKINAERHIFTHTTSITYDVDTYLSLTNIGMVEMSKRLYEENGKIKLRKSEDKK